MWLRVEVADTLSSTFNYRELEKTGAAFGVEQRGRALL
jgi:hypothetical protein